jgi:hypothetical protein
MKFISMPYTPELFSTEAESKICHSLAYKLRFVETNLKKICWLLVEVPKNNHRLLTAAKFS